MNKNLSPVEELRIKRALLKAEEQSHLLALNENISYLQENVGSLLLNAGWTAAKAQLPRTALLDQILDITPIVFNGMKPVILAFILKKIKKMIFK